MVKQIIILIIASLIVILASDYLNPILTWLMQLNDWLCGLLKQVFSRGLVGHTLTHALPLFVIPVVLGGLVSAVYWMFKRAQMAYFNEVMWAIWLVLTVLLLRVAS